MSNFIDFSSAKKLHEMQAHQNNINQLFGIKYPIIQGGMIWHSGWKLASAVSNAGGLGLIGAGSMYPDILRENIQKCKQATDKPSGVNVPMLYPNIEEIINNTYQLIETECEGNLYLKKDFNELLHSG